MIRTVDEYKISGKASFSTYIITIAKNTFIDYTRRNRIVFNDISETEPQSTDDTENRAITKMQYEEILKYIDDLPPNQASVIRLKYIEEYTLREIEEITGVPSKTVKSRIHEGTKKLRSFLNFKKES